MEKRTTTSPVPDKPEDSNTSSIATSNANTNNYEGVAENNQQAKNSAELTSANTNQPANQITENSEIVGNGNQFSKPDPLEPKPVISNNHSISFNQSNQVHLPSDALAPANGNSSYLGTHSRENKPLLQEQNNNNSRYGNQRLDLTFHEPPDSYENDEYNIPTPPVANNQAPTYAMGVIEDDADQELNDQSQHCSCFGKKFKKTVGTAIVVNLIGIALFISGIMLILYQGSSAPEEKSNNPWGTPPKTDDVSSVYLMATVMSTFGGFLVVFGTAWYCFVKKNITRRAPDTHIVVPSEYDSKEQPTAFTDVNFSEMDGDGMSLYNDTSFAHGAPRNFSVNNRQSDELRRSAIKNSVGLRGSFHQI